ncbi:MAG: hypothetical protein HRT93_10795 [Piscirickettsiaceae bacterium]|nr:hypothetical protein [Piscirickettsiaceae bacterium]
MALPTYDGTTVDPELFRVDPELFRPKPVRPEGRRLKEGKVCILIDKRSGGGARDELEVAAHAIAELERTINEECLACVNKKIAHDQDLKTMKDIYTASCKIGSGAVCPSEVQVSMEMPSWVLDTPVNNPSADRVPYGVDRITMALNMKSWEKEEKEMTRIEKMIEEQTSNFGSW